MTTESTGLGGSGAGRLRVIESENVPQPDGQRLATSRRLLIFAPNWLGDAVMALPAMDAVRAALPEATIDVAARSAVAPLFTLASGFGEVVTLDGVDASALKARRYDTALLFPNSFNVARLARRAGIAERWGYGTDFRSWLLTRSVTPPVRLHQVEYYRHLVSALGFSGGTGEPRLALSVGQRAAGASALEQDGWTAGAPLVAMAPGAAFGSAKRWPATSFAGLVDQLSADGVRTVLIGSRGDRAAGVELMAAVGASGRPIDLIGRTDLPLLAGVLAHCRALVTNDSGAMHFAAAFGVNVVVMFGPTRERETYPRGAGRHAFLTHPVWCRPCMLRECPLTHRCMTGISVAAVHVATQSLL
jgi:heptosyltransferase-2